MKTHRNIFFYNLQWSLRSTITPDTRDMWTDTYKSSTSEDYFIPSDRSDSGITSPYNQQHSDDFSQCDLPVNFINTFPCVFVVRKKLHILRDSVDLERSVKIWNVFLLLETVKELDISILVGIGQGGWKLRVK